MTDISLLIEQYDSTFKEIQELQTVFSRGLLLNEGLMANLGKAWNVFKQDSRFDKYTKQIQSATKADDEKIKQALEIVKRKLKSRQKALNDIQSKIEKHGDPELVKRLKQAMTDNKKQAQTFITAADTLINTIYPDEPAPAASAPPSSDGAAPAPAASAPPSSDGATPAPSDGDAASDDIYRQAQKGWEEIIKGAKAGNKKHLDILNQIKAKSQSDAKKDLGDAGSKPAVPPKPTEEPAAGSKPAVPPKPTEEPAAGSQQNQTKKPAKTKQQTRGSNKTVKPSKVSGSPIDPRLQDPDNIGTNKIDNPEVVDGEEDNPKIQKSENE
jgi:hypothetical protein